VCPDGSIIEGMSNVGAPSKFTRVFLPCRALEARASREK
jgi:hypothetical protein